MNWLGGMLVVTLGASSHRLSLTGALKRTKWTVGGRKEEKKEETGPKRRKKRKGKWSTTMT